jgi:hypothetical protein
MSDPDEKPDEPEEDDGKMPDVLEAVNRGRALRGAPPLEKLPSFYDDPNDYE